MFCKPRQRHETDEKAAVVVSRTCVAGVFKPEAAFGSPRANEMKSTAVTYKRHLGATHHALLLQETDRETPGHEPPTEQAPCQEHYINLI